MTNKEKNFAQKKAQDFNFLTFLYQLYSTYILFLCFFGYPFYKIKFTENKKLDKNKKYIYAPNHISYFDVFLARKIIKGYVAYMAKKELFQTDTPKHAWISRNIDRLGAFAVNRERLALSTIKTVKEAFKAGFSLCIFPQGGIRKNKTIENINAGFIYFAKTNKADIVPIAISGLEQYNWNLFKKPKVNVTVGEVISYELDEQEILKQWCEQISNLTGYENKQNFKN